MNLSLAVEIYIYISHNLHLLLKSLSAEEKTVSVKIPPSENKE